MSRKPTLKKEQSIVLDDINNIDNKEEDKNKEKSSTKILKTNILTSSQEYQSPIGSPPDFNLNLNGEIKKRAKEEKTAVCWNCQSLLIVKNGWDIVECSECHKLNRIRPNDNNTIDQNISITKSYGNLNEETPFIFGVVICPLCETENKFRKNAVNTTCYKCGNIINLNSSNNLFNSYNNNNFNRNFETINRSYDFSSPLPYINTPYYPNVIQLRGLMPYPPMVPCYGNCTECTLNKILKALQKRPKETYIPYPMFPYYQREPEKEIRYIPMNTEVKKPEPDDEYKITIRKRPKGTYAKSSGKYHLPTNKAFEKVFFSKLK